MGLPSLLLKDTFDNIEVVRDYEGPVLVVHGREDRTVPTQHGLRLHRAAPNSELLLLDGDHNSVPEEWDRFWMAMLEFLEENGVLARSEPGAN
jgi:hypothetical protein